MRRKPDEEEDADERTRNGGGFRLVSLRFNRNPIETCGNAQGETIACMVYRLAHVAHYFQSRSQI